MGYLAVDGYLLVLTCGALEAFQRPAVITDGLDPESAEVNRVASLEVPSHRIGVLFVGAGKDVGQEVHRLQRHLLDTSSGSAQQLAKVFVSELVPAPMNASVNNLTEGQLRVESANLFAVFTVEKQGEQFGIQGRGNGRGARRTKSLKRVGFPGVKPCFGAFGLVGDELGFAFAFHGVRGRLRGLRWSRG